MDIDTNVKNVKQKVYTNITLMFIMKFEETK